MATQSGLQQSWGPPFGGTHSRLEVVWWGPHSPVIWLPGASILPLTGTCEGSEFSYSESATVGLNDGKSHATQTFSSQEVKESSATVQVFSAFILDFKKIRNGDSTTR